ncbi:MAG: hypothetical protein J5722_11780 [Oscillospiraceae bacterium]|nr:hypothetical protein [Oscillospiraceae bacterium]
MDKKRRILIAILIAAAAACIMYPAAPKAEEDTEPQVTTVSGGSYQSYYRPVETTVSGTTAVWSIQAHTKD